MVDLVGLGLPQRPIEGVAVKPTLRPPIIEDHLSHYAQITAKEALSAPFNILQVLLPPE
jgi:hypothetical protein